MAEKKTEKQENPNLRFYKILKVVPEEAKKTIQGGNISGMTDINPSWRLGIMTEVFGPCGIGWKYEILKQWTEVYGEEVKAFTNINLYIKDGEQWSEPIPGTGGSSAVSKTSKGYLMISDEHYKMSLTDALSVSMKALGVGGDVYFGKGVNFFDSKYEQANIPASAPQPQPMQAPPQVQIPQPQPAQQPAQPPTPEILAEIAAAKTQDDLVGIWNKYPACQKHAAFTGALTARKDSIFGNNKS